MTHDLVAKLDPSPFPSVPPLRHGTGGDSSVKCPDVSSNTWQSCPAFSRTSSQLLGRFPANRREVPSNLPPTFAE